MDELDFTISASGKIGNFMWEYPEDVKNYLLAAQKNYGEEAVRGVMALQKQSMLVLINCLLTIVYGGRFARPLMENVSKHLKNMTEEGNRIINSGR